ncbi:hypothetical protein VTK73DRAFT_5792 [Phialemonium thermophilum]|uniref:D-ribose pyranase n=1 Tax=Phialemonium thermophilum TaxID=223376 RepID=A0ABR3V0G7_9PEZI
MARSDSTSQLIGRWITALGHQDRLVCIQEGPSQDSMGFRGGRWFLGLEEAAFVALFPFHLGHVVLSRSSACK